VSHAAEIGGRAPDRRRIHRQIAVATAFVVGIVLVTAACTAPSRSAAPSELTIFGAASLGGALEALTSAYESDHPDTSITLSTDSSAALATQIEQGAPADVFLSADRSNAQRLTDEGLTSGLAIDFAGNDLAIVVPTGNPGRVRSPADLSRPGLKIIAAGDAVPITGYAMELVDHLAREPGYPTDFSARYRANIVSKEDNVRAVLAKIELGEGDAGIVYRTDAAGSDAVESIAIPEAANVAATYTGVVIAASPRQAAARMFLDWLTGADGQAILARFGFVEP
jgi:molybdate transport system substrate-binding protein